jgi:hypothetical protein
MPLVPGCPEPLAKQALQDAAIAFCEESLVIREKQNFTTFANTSTYTLTSPTDQQPARVMNLWVDGVLILPSASDSVTAVSSTAAQPVTYYTTRDSSVFLLNLYPQPDAVYTIIAEVAMRPIRAAASLQDDLFDLWIEPIVEGALARLMSMPGQSFTDQPASMAMRASSLSKARKARTEGGIGRVRASRRVTPNPFA